MAKELKFGFLISAALGKGFKGVFASAGASINDLEKQAANGTQQLTHGISLASNQTVKLNKGLDETASKSGKLSGLGSKFESFMKGPAGRFIKGAAFTTGTFSLAKRLLSANTAANEFESTMADVRKVVDFDTPDQFRQMGKDILNLSKYIPMSAEGLAKIVAAGGQSGIARQDLTAFAGSAAKMGIAFDITADEAGEMMAKWRTAFKMNQTQVETLADKINYLGNTTAASAPLISDVVTRIGPLGAVGGLAAGEIAAMGASLVGSGVQSEVAATGLKNFILAMTSGESATKTQHEAFAKLGLDAETMAAKMQKNAKGAIIEVLTAINRLDKERQSSTLKELFGKESIGAIAPLLTNIDNLKANFDGVADAEKYAGSMQKEFEARSDTTANKLQLMENRVNAAKIALGNGFLPVIAPVAETLGSLATAIGKFAEESPNAAKYLGLLAASAIALTGFSSAIYTIYNGVKAVGLIYEGVSKLGMFAKLASGFKNIIGLVSGLSGVLAALPIGWVLIGISALVVGGTLLYRHWDKVKAFFTNLWENPTARMLMFVTGPIGWVIGAVTAIIANWDTLKSYFQFFWDNPSAAIFRFQNYLKEQLQGAIDWVYEKWEKLKEFLSNPISVTVAKKMLESGRYDADLGEYEVGKNATGGIYGKGAFLTTFAEESGESAIPHKPTKRNVGLLAKTNQIMGNPLQPKVNVYTQFNPVINAEAKTPNINVQAPAVTLPDIPPAVMAAQKAPVVNPVFNPTFNAMASTPSVTVSPAVVKQPAINVHQADMTVPLPVIQVPESKPILQAPPVIKNMIQAVADSPIVKTFVKAVAAVPDIIVNPASPVLKPIFTSMAKVPDVIVNQETMPPAYPQAPNVYPVVNVPKADTPQVKIGQRIQALAKTPVVTAMFNPQAQPAGLPDINVPQSTQKETLVERIKEIVRPQERPAETAPINITFSPNIVVNGNTDRQEVQQATEMSFQKFRELMEQFQREQRRVQYG